MLEQGVRGDFAIIARALEDTIAEPRRAPLVPGLAVIKRAAVEAFNTIVRQAHTRKQRFESSLRDFGREARPAIN